MLKLYLRFFGPKLLRWLTKFWMPLGKRIVVVGGGIHGCEMAEFLVKRGRKVTIVEATDALGDGMVTRVKPHLFRWFDRKGVRVFTGAAIDEITDRGLIIKTKEGKRETIEADNVAVALPLAADTRLLDRIMGKVPEVYAIGDCTKPGLIADAIADGWKRANAI